MHFAPEDIEKNAEAFDEKSGTLISAPLQRPRLKQGAVPRLFPKCPTYLTNSKTSRKSPSAKRKRNEEESIDRSLKLSVISKQQYDKDRNFSSFEELISCNSKHLCSPFWDVVIRPECRPIVFLHLDISEQKTDLIYAVAVHRDLHLSFSHHGKPVTKLNDRINLGKK